MDRSDRFEDRRKRRTSEEIAREQIEHHYFAIEDLKEPARSQPESGIRQEIMITMYKEGYGPTEIGDFFNRDSGTVLYAVRK